MKTFEELSRPDHWSQNHGTPGIPDLCAGLPANHPICSGGFPGGGNPNPPPLSPVPEPSAGVMLLVGIVGIALLKAFNRR